MDICTYKSKKNKQLVSAKIISSKLILGLLVRDKKASKANDSALLGPYGKANACLPNQGGKKHYASAAHTLSHYHLTVTL